MKNHFFISITITLLLTSGFINGQNQYYNYLIFPDTSEQIILVQAKKLNFKTSLLTGIKCDSNYHYFKKIKNELDFLFHQSVLKLNQCSRNLSGDSKGPNILFISNNEGGFPRKGIAFPLGGKLIKYENLNFVDLVVRDYMLEDGAIGIYSHELGHVMMNNIWSDFPDQISQKQHVSMGITDYYKAFYEGWGIHFQRLAYDNVDLYRVGFENKFNYDRINKLWHSNIDENLRINNVLNNGYIYRKQMPQNINLDTLSFEDLILIEHTSPIYDYSKLKNAQEMLSCEGVLATFFYKINTNKKLQESYQENTFYEHFLLKKIPLTVNTTDIFTPFENIILKNFWVWHKIKTTDFNQNQILVEFIKEWCNSFPEDRNEIIKIYLLVTIGKTVNNNLGAIYEQMCFYGSIGNYKRYKKLSQQYFIEFALVKEKVLNDFSLLTENIGPELWIENPDVLVRRTLWNSQNKKTLLININTATLYEIASFKGFNILKAQSFIKKRDELGYFNSFEDAENYGFLIK